MNKKRHSDTTGQQAGAAASPSTQLTLPVHINDDARFDNFLCNEQNALALESIRSLLTRVITNKQHTTRSSLDAIFLFGSPGVGCSHLLQAACDAIRQQGGGFQYLPLSEFRSWPAAQVLEGLESLDLIALDDVETIAGNRDWEEGVFHLYNRVQASGAALLMAAHQSPNDMALTLEDLRSRLNWGLVRRLAPLSDEDKVALLQLRAKHRGLLLDDEVVQFIVRRSARDTKSLLAVLDRLDIASLHKRRKITIPFIKEVLDW